MADDMADKLKSVLNNPEMLNMISSLINSSNENSTSDFADDDSVTNIKNMVNQLNTGSDKRITLLNALRPYMRGSRAHDIDKAVKILKITKLGSIFKDL